MTHEVGTEGRSRRGQAMSDPSSADPTVREPSCRDADLAPSTATKAEILARLIGSLDDGGPSATDILLAERRLDRQREDRKLGFDS
ncbi:hypothetical protein VSS74_25605 [Conexibacter stalactiti]|uniref:Uncharacterized protein n=1 Tax=Conexibacter stalactiti TaxID=1940611 RepID=A0ABU4I0A5_9ACTN|nr:hypothetical protein [Conexibacter stalactiti]MDW5597754.1 hypothetical protein [Conexibacter stalactiti]MEC5038396.1 hypothetical protein [Conexibacter stalactiti]